MDITEINKQIQRERMCIEDFSKELAMFIREGHEDKAFERFIDIGKSFKSIEQLNRLEKLHALALKFNGKVVKRYANQG